MHPAALTPADLLKQVTETRTKRSGPGGQHRNKTETAVVLVHRPTGISAEGSERRSHVENRQFALRRLRLKLAVELREPAAIRISGTWLARVRARQLVIASSHEDFPALLAEALDHLHEAQWQVSPAAHKLNVTTSQLIGLFKKAPAAWAAVNKHRLAIGLPALR
ncbi:MAG: peptide chain release factor family protein [Planctomycetia bacterium]